MSECRRVFAVVQRMRHTYFFLSVFESKTIWLKVFANTEHVIAFINVIIYCSSCETLLACACASSPLISLLPRALFPSFVTGWIRTSFVVLRARWWWTPNDSFQLLGACISNPISVSFDVFRVAFPIRLITFRGFRGKKRFLRGILYPFFWCRAISLVCLTIRIISGCNLSLLNVQWHELQQNGTNCFSARKHSS